MIMNPIIVSPVEFVEGSFTQYELPPEGISLLGYVVRRLHKTELLASVPDLLHQENIMPALFAVAHYTAASSVTFGKLYYEPRRDRPGSIRTENDPHTGAAVTAVLESSSPDICLAYDVSLPSGACFHGRETNSDASVSLRGWVHTVICQFQFHHPATNYTATINGNILREIVPHLAGPWHIRAHGSLELSDSYGHAGRLILQRNATVNVLLTSPTGQICQQTVTLY
jgi:hypothetical protein